jgi:hypothetical protein
MLMNLNATTGKGLSSYVCQHQVVRNISEDCPRVERALL